MSGGQFAQQLPAFVTHGCTSLRVQSKLALSELGSRLSGTLAAAAAGVSQLWQFELLVELLARCYCTNC